MKIRSITLKLLPFIICSYILITLGVFVLSKVQLTKIIDKSQQAIFAEKLGVIWETLHRADERLQQTGLVEAYADDFRAATISNLINTYYRQPHFHVKPIIIDMNSNVIIHPILPAGYVLTNDNKNLFPDLMTDQGQFYAVFSGKKVWCTYSVFEPWDWIILYAVPIGEKYADVSEYSTLLFFTMFTITSLVAVFLSLVITYLMRPIRTLTLVTEEVSNGNWEQPVNIRSNDEIGVLAKSFNRMRNAVYEQITKLSREVSERKKIERELRCLERYLSDIINSMPSAIIGIDTKKRITQWSKKAEEITGIPASEAYQKPLEEAFPELAELLPLISESMAFCDTKRLAKRERQTEDGLVYEDLTIYPLADRTETGHGAVIRIDDVTKEHALEMQVYQSSKLESLGKLAGGVAHDFNNMLAAVIGNTELAMLTVKPKDPLNDQLKAIYDVCFRSAGLVRQLLTFARKQKIKPKMLDINYTISSLLKVLHRLIGEDIELIWIPGDIEEKVRIDPSQMDQVLTNLMVNARDAIAGVGKVTIGTGIKVIDEDYCRNHSGFLPGRFVMLNVSDNGVGIDEETLPTIFDPFFTTKGLGKGTGLGLSTVYGIVKQNQGFVNVYSEPGQGTTFRIYLPAVESVENISSQKKDVAIPPKGTETVLIVEDDTTALYTAKSILEKLGYTVLVAATPDEAVTLTESCKGRIDLLLADVVLPQMNGLELAQRLSESTVNLKCIFMSGYPADEIENLGVSGEGINFIQKPFPIMKIAVKVREVLDAVST